MLLVVLFALFAGILGADEDVQSLEVDVSCEEGWYTGGVTVTITYQGSNRAKGIGEGDGETPGVWYKTGEEGWNVNFYKGSCVHDDIDKDMYCEKCKFIESGELKDTEVLVVMPRKRPEGDSKEREIIPCDLAIKLTNASFLDILADDEEDISSKVEPNKGSWNIVKEINIEHAQGFYDWDSGERGEDKILPGKPDPYCGRTVSHSGEYPKGDCYRFEKLSITGVDFASSDNKGLEVNSNRKIGEFYFEGVNIYGELVITIDVYPGIYNNNYADGEGGSGYCSGTDAEFDAITTMTLKNVYGSGSGTINMSAYGNIMEAYWENVSMESEPLSFNVGARRKAGSEYKWDYDFCPSNTGHNCCEDDYARGAIGYHDFKNVTLPEKSKIVVSGWVNKIEADQLKFGPGSSSKDNDNWVIVEKCKTFDDPDESDYLDGSERMSFEGDDEYNVHEATFKGDNVIQTDIHYTIHTLDINKSEFKGDIESESEDVKIQGSTMSGHIRHIIRDSLAVTGSVFKEDTYYDHDVDKSYPTYPKFVIDDVKVHKDFVVSADNAEEIEINKTTFTKDIILRNVTCYHNWDVNEEEKDEWYEPTDSAKLFLLRHMSDSVIMSDVKGCNLYFKNNVDVSHGHLDLGRPEIFTYRSENTEGTEGEGGVKSEYNNLTIFDNAEYHVTSNIIVKGVESDKPEFGYIKFNHAEVKVPVPVHFYDDMGYDTKTTGTSYPVNINLENLWVYHLLVSQNDDNGLKDPEGNMDDACPAIKEKRRDITDAPEDRANDDMNITIENSEIVKTNLSGDSLVLRANKWLSSEDVEIELHESSSIRISDARFMTMTLDSYEPLELAIVHSVFDDMTDIHGHAEGDFLFRSVLFTNSNPLLDYSQPKAIRIEVEEGFLKLDHVKIIYGDMEVMNRYGDIEAVMALPNESASKIILTTVFGSLDVTHPKKYYHDLNSLVDFEYESGNMYGNEYVETDIFAFEPSFTLHPLTSSTENVSPYIRTGKIEIMAQYGDLKWTYADNLQIGSITSKSASDSQISFENFDNVFAISSIYAVGAESFLDFDIANLNPNNIYYVAVRDHSGADGDVTKTVTMSQSGDTWKCDRADSSSSWESDPFDICLGYVILPTYDLSAKPSVENAPTLNVTGGYLYMKDAASSMLKELKLNNVSGFYVNNLVAGTVTATLKYARWDYVNWMRGSADITLASVAANSISVTSPAPGEGEVDDIELSGVIVLSNAKYLGINPSSLEIKGASRSTNASVTKMIPSGTTSKLVCAGGVADISNSDKAYDTCTFINGNSSGNGSVNFASDSQATTNAVTIDVSVENLVLEISYMEADSLEALVNKGVDANTMNSDATLELSAGDKIVIDNHYFAVDVVKDKLGENDKGNTQGLVYPGYFNHVFNNIYVIKSTSADTIRGVVTFDTNADKMLYRKEKFTTKDVTSPPTQVTHKFNLIEQASMYLYVPERDNISMVAAGLNVNFILGDIGVYDRIDTHSYLLANALRAKVVSAVSAMIYDLRAVSSLSLNFGHIGLDASKVDADISVFAQESDRPDVTPIIMLEKGTIDNLGVYTRNYKTITVCRDTTRDISIENFGESNFGEDGGCGPIYVPCREDKCEFVNYMWGPTSKLFWAGHDYSNAIKNKTNMKISFKPDVSKLKKMCDNSISSETTRCPNTPAYVDNVELMSGLTIRGQSTVPKDFESYANKNNRQVDPTSLGEVEVPKEESGMPGWAAGLIVLTCIMTAILIVMFVLRLLGKESISDMRSGSATAGVIN